MSRIKMWRMTAFVVGAGLCALPIVGAAATRVGNDGATAAAREGDQAKLKEIAHGLKDTSGRGKGHSGPFEG
jgi:hypothetical protein